MPMLPAAIAEFVGTFILTAVIVTQQNQPIALLFALVGVVLIIGGVSGAHVNPAITVGAWVTKKIQASRAVMYLAAQILGAMLAFVVLNGFINQAPEVGEQAAMFGQAAAQLFVASPIPDGKVWTILFAELIGAAILGLAYANALQKGRSKIEAAFSVGGGIFLALVVAGTAASYVQGTAILNPAAAISLEAFSSMKDMQPLLVYALTPAIGASLGMMLFTMINRNEK